MTGERGKDREIRDFINFIDTLSYSIICQKSSLKSIATLTYGERRDGKDKELQKEARKRDTEITGERRKKRGCC